MTIFNNITPLQREIISSAVVVFTYIIIFIIAKIVYKIFPKKTELSRKTAHLLSGLLALSFPWILSTYWSLIIIGTIFISFLTVMKLLGKLQSIHGVERKSFGSFLFPIAIFLIYILGRDRPIYYFVSILVLAVSDTTAALVGGRYGSVKIEIEGNLKSLEGAISFSFITFLCIHIPLLLMTNLTRLQCVLISFVVSCVVCGFELISIYGTDNLFVPLGTFYIAERMSRYPVIRNFATIFQLFLSIGLTTLIFFKVPAIKSSWIIGMILLNFESYSLCGLSWFVPMIIFDILLAISMYLYRKNTNDENFYKVKMALFMGIIPAVIMFIPATFENYIFFYKPFLASIIIQVTLISNYYLCYIFKIKNILNKRNRFSAGIILTLINTLLIAGLPMIIFNIKNIFNDIFFISIYISIIFISVLIGWISNLIINTIYFKTEDKKICSKNAKWFINIISSIITVTIVILFQLIEYLIVF